MQSQRGIHRPLTPTASQKYVVLAPPSPASRSGPAAGSQLMRMMSPAAATTSSGGVVVVTLDSAADSTFSIVTHNTNTSEHSSL